MNLRAFRAARQGRLLVGMTRLAPPRDGLYRAAEAAEVIWQNRSGRFFKSNRLAPHTGQSHPAASVVVKTDPGPNVKPVSPVTTPAMFKLKCRPPSSIVTIPFPATTLAPAT